MIKLYNSTMPKGFIMSLISK